MNNFMSINVHVFHAIKQQNTTIGFMLSSFHSSSVSSPDPFNEFFEVLKEIYNFIYRTSSSFEIKWAFIFIMRQCLLSKHNFVNYAVKINIHLYFHFLVHDFLFLLMF